MIKRKKAKFKRVKKNLFNIQTVFAAIGVVMIWRGVWELLDHYLFTLFAENPDIAAVISILIGLFILFIDDYEFDELREKK
jgi:uncharacterized membrane protein